ncbi:TPA: acetylpolyamine aminohydrolase [Legionella pneumophila]|nr:acetylpolyamine aminohydrolase [Legionella pneumophila]
MDMAKDKGFFKKAKMEKNKRLVTPYSEECAIQIPSEIDNEQMQRMPAGGEEDQYLRIKHMSALIKKYEDLPVITTQETSLPYYWLDLFAAIDEGDTPKAHALFHLLPQDDIILRALRAVHSEDYLYQLIKYCIQAKHFGFKQLNADLVVTPKTFEILIRDCATTLFNPAKAHFSFGLPSHHAYTQMGSGFCLINKTAMLMKQAELSSAQPPKFVIIGTDVNRDNGLCDILRHSFSHLSICHIDVFDSRVYPQQDFAYINNEFNSEGVDIGKNIHVWHHNNLNYYAVDLSLTSRKSVGVHPALLFALEQLKESIREAKAKGQKIALYLPTGWDSHEDETAYCGKFVNGRMMGKTAAHQFRFNDGDLGYFYESIFTLYNENKDCIDTIYWGLEGGYDRTMYERELKILLQVIEKQLLPKDSNSHSMSY